MNDDKYCQSCGALLARPIDHGTNADRSFSDEYCHYCYQNGQFSEPALTLELMINKKAKQFHVEMNMPEEEALQKAQAMITPLRRWKSQGI